MKKIILLLAFQALCVWGFAQKTVFINEGFSSVPPTSWTIDAQSGNWSAAGTNNAGGTAPEARFYYSPTFTGQSRLISPSVDLTGVAKLFLSFQHYVNHYTTPYTVGVATRANNGAWHTVWSSNPSNSTGGTVSIEINNGDQTSSNFQFCFFFDGNSYNINYWYLDNVLLYEPYSVDAKMVKNNVPLYIEQGNTSIVGTINNYGYSSITGFTVNYRIDSGANLGTPQATTLSGLNIAVGSNYNFSCTPQWSATVPGKYNIFTWISDVNSLGPDSCVTNDTINKLIGVATQTTTRIPVFEEFTSSSCGPCASFNSSTFTPFFNSYGTQFSLIKYQMNWPGNGDPYYTAEGGTRRSFYGVSVVPDLYVDGRASGSTSGTMLSELNTDKAKATFFVISGLTPTYDGTNITVPLTITPYVTGAFKLHVVVIEKLTTGNVSSTPNGETSWKHVMMKMLTTGSGETVNFVPGTNFNHTYTYDMSSTHVEEMSDLQVVVMIQETTTKEIYQSAETDIAMGIDNSTEDNFSIYPNPANENIMIVNAQNSDITLYDLYGKAVLNSNNISNNFSLNVSELPAGTYILRIINGDKISSKKISVIK